MVVQKHCPKKPESTWVSGLSIRGFLCFFSSTFSIKKLTLLFGPVCSDFRCQGCNVGCNKHGNWPFTYHTHFEGGIWPLGLLRRGILQKFKIWILMCTPSCKGPYPLENHWYNYATLGWTTRCLLEEQGGTTRTRTISSLWKTMAILDQEGTFDASCNSASSQSLEKHHATKGQLWWVGIGCKLSSRIMKFPTRCPDSR